MNKTVGRALVVMGIVLVILGINASDALGSDLSRFFTAPPTGTSIWLLGGIGAGIVGLFLTVTSRKSGKP